MRKRRKTKHIKQIKEKNIGQTDKIKDENKQKQEQTNNKKKKANMEDK